MDIQPIKIDIDDNRAFAQVASLVDRQAFLDGLKPLIKKYKLQSPLEISVNGVAKHFRYLIGVEKGEVQIVKGGKPALAYFLEYAEKFLDFLIENNDLPDKKKDLRLGRLTKSFFDDVKNLRRSLRYPLIFDGVIAQALFFREVFYFSTACPVIFNEPPYSYEAEPNDDFKRNALFAIVVTPNSTDEDIKKSMKTIKTDFVKLVGSDQYSGYSKFPDDTITFIKRNREWYWLNNKKRKSWLSYEKIADKYDSGKYTVRFAIQAYKKLLGSKV